MDGVDYARSFCRLLQFGVPPGDVQALAEEADWIAWGRALGARAEAYAEDGARALQEGRLPSAEALLRTAAACFHFARFKLPIGEEWAVLGARSRGAFALAAPLSTPATEPVAIELGDLVLPGYARRQASAAAPWVLLVHGLDSAKEVELDHLAQGLVRRGASVLYVDFPGQGELAGTSSLRQFDAAFARAVSWIGTYGVEPPCLGVLGVSLGGHLACRAAALTPQVRSVVCLGGFFDLAALVGLPAPALAKLRVSYGIDGGAPLAELGAAIDLAPLPTPAAPHLLLVHGAKDHLADGEQMRRLLRWAPQSILRQYAGGEHVCTNLFARCLPDAWDFMLASLRTAERQGAEALAP